MKTVNIHAAKTNPLKLVEEAAGNAIVIAKAGKPIARLVPLAKPARRRAPGRLKHLFQVKDNFDDPLPPNMLDPGERSLHPGN